MVQGLIKQIQNLRNKNFEKIFNEALKLSEKIGIEGDFIEKRNRVKNQDICYNITPKESFKIKIFQIMDTLITQSNEDLKNLMILLQISIFYLFKV